MTQCVHIVSYRPSFVCNDSSVIRDWGPIPKMYILTFVDGHPRFVRYVDILYSVYIRYPSLLLARPLSFCVSGRFRRYGVLTFTDDGVTLPP